MLYTSSIILATTYITMDNKYTYAYINVLEWKPNKDMLDTDSLFQDLLSPQGKGPLHQIAYYCPITVGFLVLNLQDFYGTGLFTELVIPGAFPFLDVRVGAVHTALRVFFGLRNSLNLLMRLFTKASCTNMLYISICKYI